MLVIDPAGKRNSFCRGKHFFFLRGALVPQAKTEIIGGSDHGQSAHPGRSQVSRLSIHINTYIHTPTPGPLHKALSLLLPTYVCIYILPLTMK